jgi:hypothetical protein
MNEPLRTNTHIHTPYSFSAFDSVEQAVSLAAEEQVKVLGISDFNTLEGYDEFSRCCAQHRIYPLFNMENITLNSDDRDNGVSWNDSNPGIVYFCAKALDYPVNLSPVSRQKIHSLWEGTQNHIRAGIEKLNAHMASLNMSITFDYETIRSRFAKNTIRERHLSKAIYTAMVETFAEPVARLAGYRQLFADAQYSRDMADINGLQDDIRSRLLRTGKPAYVPEDTSAFMPLERARQLCLDAGGVPCYPVWADDKAGLSVKEKDLDSLADTLVESGIHCVEFIPLRNTFDHLKKYVSGFVNRGFPVVFGTEHNTPTRIPLNPAARGGVAFDAELMTVAYQGACMLAAHQELHMNRQEGFVSSTGNRLVEAQNFNEFAKIGEAAIHKAIGD